MLRQTQQIGGDEVHKVDRVLDVRQGELVWVAGTVYMEMPLKPNILDDISKHVKFTNICPLPFTY
jgi:DNA polymerase delta subunit 2